jgi:peptidoglycan/LPS O-acetylase OafA/YrhL
MDQTSQKQSFVLVQALRALAAFSVAFLHISFAALSLNPGDHALSALYHALPWEAGVDIFFVISGFVIVTASTRFFATAGGQSAFLRRRLARIVPLYWLMTTLFLATLAASRHAIHGAIGGPLYILASYLFIPFARPDGLVQPAFGLGWTLNYEMVFYLTFTLFLGLPKQRAVPAACLGFLIFVLAGQAHIWHGTILTTWSNPIILEFCAGMLIALCPGKIRLQRRARLALVALAFAIFILAPSGWPDIASQGVPAACLLAAAALGAPARNRGLITASLILGDASYALYLVHPFIMRGFEIIAPHIAALRHPLIYIPLCLALSQLAALALHRWFEIPVTNRLRPAPRPAVMPASIT